MSRIPQFKQDIISYIEKNGQDADIVDWINRQPELDQPDLLRALLLIISENFNLKPDVDREKIELIVEDKIQQFEESILDEKLQKSLFTMEMEEMINDQDTFEYFLDFTRQEIITRIITNSKNEENWNQVHKMIQIEKDSGYYNPDNWKAIM